MDNKLSLMICNFMKDNWLNQNCFVVKYCFILQIMAKRLVQVAM